MEYETKNKDLYNNSLYQSYCDSTSRVIRCTKQACFTFQQSSHVLEKREKFWSSLFRKYSNDVSEVSEDQPKNQKKYKGKNLQFVQYWVNTGRIAHTLVGNMHEDSDYSGLSIEEKLKNSCCLFHVGSDSSKADGKQYFNYSSSYSSVDTAAYILSNANVTNKAETMAIIEHNKHSMNFPDLTPAKQQNMDVFRNAISSIDNNSNTYNNCIFKIFSPDKVENTKTLNKLLQKNSVEAEKVGQILTDNDSIDETVQSTADAISKTCSKDSSDEELFASNVFTSSTNTTTKTCNRKRLYSGKISPVDVHQLINRTSNKISFGLTNVHPALATTETSIKRRSRISAKRKRKRFTNLFLSRQHSSSEDVVSQTDIKKKREVKISRSKHSNKNASTSSIESASLVPEKSAENNEIKNNFSLLEKARLSPVIRLEVLSLEKILKYKKPDCSAENLKRSKQLGNPIVRLERLSEDEIAKYKKSSHSKINLEGLKSLENSIVRLELSSPGEVSKRKTPFRSRGKRKRVSSRSAFQFDSPIIDLRDSVSDQSTVFIYERTKSKLNSSSSKISLSSGNSAQDVLCISSIDSDNADNHAMKGNSSFSNKSCKALNTSKLRHNLQRSLSPISTNTSSKKNFKLLKNNSLNSSNPGNSRQSEQIRATYIPWEAANPLTVNFFSDDEYEFVKLVENIKQKKRSRCKSDLTKDRHTLRCSNPRSRILNSSSQVSFDSSVDETKNTSPRRKTYDGVYLNLRNKKANKQKNASSRVDAKEDESTMKSSLFLDTSCHKLREKKFRRSRYKQRNSIKAAGKNSIKAEKLYFRTRLDPDSDSPSTSIVSDESLL